MAIVNGTKNADTLYGTSTADTIRGGAGNDSLKGFGGADHLDGGTGYDAVFYGDSAVGVTVDLAAGRGQGGSAEGDTYASIEIVHGSNHDDRLTGNDQFNMLHGGGGRDTLKGAGGDDYLIGEDGDDVLKGGGGADALNGGAGIDTADYTQSETAVTAYLNSPGLRGDAQGDTYTAIENVTGSAYADRLGGDDGANVLRGMNGDDDLVGFSGDDTLYGGNGVDHFHGGSGVDTLVGGPGDDVYDVFFWDGDVVVEQAGEGIDWVLSASPYVLPANVEHIWLTAGAEGANATGNDLDNLLYANQFDNVLRGEDGNDHINPREGTDTLHGGNGADVFLWETVEMAGLTPATADRILDFSFPEGDRINISTIDADIYAGGNQAFTFIGNAAFSGAPGELNYVYADGNTYIQMQTGTSADVEGVIRFDGIVTPQASWFVL